MHCGRCDSPTRVIDSRLSERRGEIRRRRKCQNCGQRFTTYERTVDTIAGIERDLRSHIRLLELQADSHRIAQEIAQLREQG